MVIKLNITLRNRLKNNNTINSTSSNSKGLDRNKYLEQNFWGKNRQPSLHSKWIPKLSDPKVQFNLDPPTHQHITNVIHKMKSSGSPSPLDQLSVICFERCPYLRTYLTELIRYVLLSGNVPSEWKRACTILIHKKGNTNDPANFRPITLESIPLKVV